MPHDSLVPRSNGHEGFVTRQRVNFQCRHLRDIFFPALAKNDNDNLKLLIKNNLLIIFFINIKTSDWEFAYISPDDADVQSSAILMPKTMGLYLS